MNHQRPNILWLMTDEQRTDSLGCYGSSWARSPNLDRLAKEGVMFHNAITPAPVCQPARTSLLTGQYPSRTGVWWNHNGKYPNELNHLVPKFADAGYRTATFGKQHYDSPESAFQTEFLHYVGEEVGFFSYAKQYDESRYSVVKYPPEPFAWIFGGTFPERMEKKVEAVVVEKSIEWLSQHPADQPFFLRVSFNGPHTPVIPPYPFDCLIRKEDIQYAPETEKKYEGRPKWIEDTVSSFADSARLTPEQIEDARRFYYGEAAFMDYQFGILLDWMEKKGLLENTIVVFMSDHGTHIGDYGLVQKQTFYNPVVNVPYIFWYPAKIAAGVEMETPVETITLLPTLLELAGLQIPDTTNAGSLAQELYTGEEPKPKPVFSEFTLGTYGVRHEDKLVMVRDGDWKLSLCFDPDLNDGELYNLADDPHEHRNLYSEPLYKDTVSRLSELVIRHLHEEMISS